MKPLTVLSAIAVFATISAFSSLSAQTISAVTLTNGPPNIPVAPPGSCTPATCAWIQAGVSNEAVSDVYADLSPISSNYGGSFSLTGSSASSFSISTSSDGTRNVGHITTAGTLSAGDYSINVCAGSTCQATTVHAVSGTKVACGNDSTIQNAANSAGAGATLLLAPSCTYSIRGAIAPQNNQIIIGAGPNSTILDGGNTDMSPAPGVFTGCPSGNCGGPTGVALMNMAVQNVGAGNGNWGNGFPGNGFGIQATGGWVVRTTVVQNATGDCFDTHNGGTGTAIFVVNNKFSHCGYDASKYELVENNGTMNFVGNEVAGANYGGNQSCNDVGGKVSPTGNALTLNFTNNWFHDNATSGIWTDFVQNSAITVSGNTFGPGGSDNALNIEQSRNWSIHHNAMAQTLVQPKNNSCDPQNETKNIGCAGCGVGIDIHDNNLTSPPDTAQGFTNIWSYNDESGNGANPSTNITVHDNTITFFSSNGGYTWDSTSKDTSGSASYNNHYHLVAGNTGSDRHWYWLNQGNSLQTFSGYQSSGQDASGGTLANHQGATIDTTDTSTFGCQHVACSGAGVGPGGVPLAAANGLSIQSIVLSNSTFTPNVANGVVGTVSVTTSDGSAFSGKLSTTGTNSGGFQVSGNILEEKASGTPAGSYNDFNLVATQSTASNSPQQVSPTVTGIVDAPFGGVTGIVDAPFSGTARSITNRIQAEDFDVGGYGVAYHATDACTLGIDTTYGPDRLNVYPTADLDSENNLKVGCNQAGDWHNYTITVPTTGTYTLNMRVADIETGSSYHVAVDGASVVSGIAVPNTGDYDTFATVTSQPFGLTAGQHILQLVLDAVGSSGFGGDFNWMQGTLVKAGAITSKNIDIIVTH